MNELRPYPGQGYQIYCYCGGLAYYSCDGDWKHYHEPAGHEVAIKPDEEMIPPAFGSCPANVPMYRSPWRM